MVSPVASAATAASCSDACRAHASTTALRTWSWSERIGSSRLSAPATSAALRVMHARDCLELGRLLLRGGVVQEVPAADLRASEVLEEARLAERRVDLDVKMKSRVGRAVRRRLVQHHHVR